MRRTLLPVSLVAAASVLVATIVAWGTWSAQVRVSSQMWGTQVPLRARDVVLMLAPLVGWCAAAALLITSAAGVDRRRRWTRGVAWLGLAITGAVAALDIVIGRNQRAIAALLRETLRIAPPPFEMIGTTRIVAAMVGVAAALVLVVLAHRTGTRSVA